MKNVFENETPTVTNTTVVVSVKEMSRLLSLAVEGVDFKNVKQAKLDLELCEKWISVVENMLDRLESGDY